MEEVDNEARIVELRLELANLKQGETENIADFIARADILARKLPGSQVDVGMAVTRGILDPEHIEKLVFECARSKNFTFSSVKTLVKALYFPRGKDRPFDPAYKEYRFALANAVNQGVSQAVHRSFGTSSFSNASYQQQCYICDEPGHYAQQCPWKGNQEQQPQQYSSQRYAQQQYNSLCYHLVQHHPPPASIQSIPVQEVPIMMAPARVEESEESFVKTRSGLLIEHKRDRGNEQLGRPPPITTPVLSSSLPLLRQRPRVHFAKKSNVISMKVLPPLQEKF
ncbi:hypothetical protein MMC31_004659 [Peltigera leucophlebia]|nr:hypothetical protein [Peltigera leucophlebia]